MAEPTEEDRRLARQARVVAIVLVATMVIWMGAQFVGGQMGWPARFVFLFDFAALAAFIWALIVTTRIWQRRRKQ